MEEVLVGFNGEFDEGTRKIVQYGEDEVVVFRHNGKYYALRNRCLHMGGPVGEGVIIGRVEAVLDDEKKLLCERFSEDEIHIVCPWHGFEYNIETGGFAGDPRDQLPAFHVVEREDQVYVTGRR